MDSLTAASSAASARSVAYRARWVLPVESRPIENGVVVIAAGKILAVKERWPGPVVDLGNVALIPGLVNCHTHLEFSALREPIQPFHPFTEWIRAVISYRRSHPDVAAAAIRQGLKESLAGGVTLLGDIATQGWDDVLTDAPEPTPQVIRFQELLGLSDTAVQQQKEKIAAIKAPVGLSPHAPYSTHPVLFEAAVAHAETHSLPVAVHLAETAAELELLQHGTGEFRTFLESLGLWQPELFDGRSCKEWLERLADLPRALIIHGNRLNDDELALLARHPGLTLVYCPRTHAAFGHPPHPWLDLISLGGSVAIGTDGRSSNPDLSLWKELQFLATLAPEVPHHSLLKLGTVNGARALGWARQCGSLTAGKQADLAVIALKSPGFENPVFQLLAPENEVVATMVQGAWGYQSGDSVSSRL